MSSATAIVKCSPFGSRGVDNAFRELSKEKILHGINTVAKVVKKYRKIRGGFWLSIAKRGLKSLDRVSKTSGKDFRLVTLEEVIDFVQWDINFNNLFVIWGTVLRHQDKGVPIGGYLSAQLMNFCLMGAQYNFVHDENCHEQLQDLLPHWPNDYPLL